MPARSGGARCACSAEAVDAVAQGDFCSEETQPLIQSSYNYTVFESITPSGV